MFDRGDPLELMQRWINLQLHGDDKQDGLLRAVLSSQDWDTFNRTKGMIQGYDNMLRATQEIVQHLNRDEERPGIRRVTN